MYNHDNIYETIEQYLEGTLTEADKVLFEKQLAIDTELQQKVLVCQSAQELIMQNKLKNLKSLMSQEQGKVNKRETLKKAGIVLIGSALLATGVGLYLHNESPKVKTPSSKESSLPKDLNSVTRVALTENEGDTEHGAMPAPRVPNSTNLLVIETEANSKGGNPVNTSPIDKDPVADVAVSQSTTMTSPVDKNVLHKHEKSPEKIVKETPQHDCHHVAITAKLSTEQACKGIDEGVIRVENLMGGLEPYRLRINGKAASTQDHTFVNLKEGNYQIQVVDANGCKQDFNPVILKAKDCPLNYDFNPNKGEQWVGPVVAKASKLNILDKRGTLVFNQQLAVGETCTWSGHNSSGTVLSGYFVFVLEQEDGTMIKGSITVTE